MPVETTVNVIQNIVKEITGFDLDTKANATTVSQFSYEIGVLSNIQVGESLVQEENLTMAWDATSLNSEHINEVHIMFPGEPPTV